MFDHHVMFEEINVKDLASQICRDYLSGVWRNIKNTSIIVRRIQKEYVNELYYCSIPNTEKCLGKEPKEAVLRIIGTGRKNEWHVVNEIIIFLSLAARKLGPQLLGVFPGGRLEEFIPGHCLTCYETSEPQIYTAIAKKLASVHHLEPPVNKSPSAMYEVMKRYALIGRKEFKLEDWNETERKNAQFVFSHNLEKEGDWCRDLLKKLDLPQVFCHNDVRGANIILKNENNKSLEEKLYFINVEFSAYNYRGYDFANFFSQWCFDFSSSEYPYFAYKEENYPTKEEQLSFIRSYLDSSKSTVGKNIPTDTEEHILEETEILLLAVHMMSVLRIIGFATPKIKTAPWEYAKIKLELYFKEKEKVLRKIKKDL